MKWRNIFQQNFTEIFSYLGLQPAQDLADQLGQVQHRHHLQQGGVGGAQVQQETGLGGENSF